MSDHPPIEAFSFSPIGILHSNSVFKAQAPRQSVYTASEAQLELQDAEQLRLALEDLAGFERIWLIFVFHHNLGHAWKSKVRPPQTPPGAKERYGLFATRSPYRPNPIGISAVELQAIDYKRGILQLGACDLLDGTPVLDIKPYIPAADAFPDAAAGWRDQLETLQEPQWELIFSAECQREIAFLNQLHSADIQQVCRTQLSRSPLDKSRKRITRRKGDTFSLGFRTWQILFQIVATAPLRQLQILGVYSHYDAVELKLGAEDRYGDKELHRAFCAAFPQAQKAHLPPPEQA